MVPIFKGQEVKNYYTTPRNIPEEGRARQHRAGSLKSRFPLLVFRQKERSFHAVSLKYTSQGGGGVPVLPSTRICQFRRLTSPLIWNEILFEKLFVLENSDHRKFYLM